jgi:hypothetical protein
MAGKRCIRELVPANQSKAYEVFKSVSQDILLALVEVSRACCQPAPTRRSRGVCNRFVTGSYRVHLRKGSINGK